MRAITDDERDLLLAAIDLALNTWERGAENDELHAIEDALITARAQGNVTVLFAWSPKCGDCYECSLPAAYRVPDAYGQPNDGRPETLRCSVCAARAGADGERLVYLFGDDFNAPEDGS